MMTTDGAPTPGRLDELLTAWSQHVDKIKSEVGLSGDDPAVIGDPRIWGAHDLPAALYIRDGIASMLADPRQVDDPGRRERLARIDETFRAITVDDQRELLGRLLNEDLGGRGWWWFRVPSTGPIADELRGYFG